MTADRAPSRPRLAEDASGTVELHGNWTLAGLAPQLDALRGELQRLAARERLWRVDRAERIDSVAALLLWRAWGRRLPPRIALDDSQRRIFEHVAAAPAFEAPRHAPRPSGLGPLIDLARHLAQGATLVGELALAAAALLLAPARLPWRELSAMIYRAGARALPIVALVGFLVGVVLSYLSAQQLRNWGADVFIVNILGLGIVRELGPLLVAILVAGRSGSALTAQFGVMRVTEEIDALRVIGVSPYERLALPRIAGLVLVMPLLVAWGDAWALFGGMLAANAQLGIDPAYFMEALPRAVPIANYFIGLGKGCLFGLLIGLIACHFGLRTLPNTESLAANTTASVVYAITSVILADAAVAMLVRGIGMPWR